MDPDQYMQNRNELENEAQHTTLIGGRADAAPELCRQSFRPGQARGLWSRPSLRARCPSQDTCRLTQMGIVLPDWPSNSQRAHLIGWKVQGQSIRFSKKCRAVPSDWPHDSEQMQLIG